MTSWNSDRLYRFKARITGGLWLAVIVTGSFGLSALFRLIVRENAAATATKIIANEFLFRLSFVADLVAVLCYVGVTVLLYKLLKPASPSLSRLAAFFGLAGIGFGGAYYLCRLAPIVLLTGDRYLGAFSTEQLQAAAMLFLKMYGLAFSLSMVLFGMQCSIVGFLMVRSALLPRVPGLLLALGGVCYVVASFIRFLSPSLGMAVAPFITPIALLGEGSVALWLLVKGIGAPTHAGTAMSDER